MFMFRQAMFMFGPNCFLNRKDLNQGRTLNDIFDLGKLNSA